MNPGPATSALRMPAAARSMRSASSSAIWRGALRRGLASVSATLVAQSPCSGLRGRSRATAGCSTPISRRARSISACSLSTAIYSLLDGPADGDEPPDEDESDLGAGLESALGAAPPSDDAEEDEPPPLLSLSAAFL